MSIVTAIYEHLYIQQSVCEWRVLGRWVSNCFTRYLLYVASPVSPVVWDPVLCALVIVTYIVGLYRVVICLRVLCIYIMSIVTTIYQHLYIQQSVCQQGDCDSRLCGSMAIVCQRGVGVIVACVAAWLSSVNVEWVVSSLCSSMVDTITISWKYVYLVSWLHKL